MIQAAAIARTQVGDPEGDEWFSLEFIAEYHLSERSHWIRKQFGSQVQATGPGNSFTPLKVFYAPARESHKEISKQKQLPREGALGSCGVLSYSEEKLEQEAVLSHLSST